ncbi:Sodium/hydrogen exchanger [Aphelenchoides fujianensis]|nr:Sodium/hydrogen exchanger [Aphelenchoides fujianensis]
MAHDLHAFNTTNLMHQSHFEQARLPLSLALIGMVVVLVKESYSRVKVLKAICPDTPFIMSLSIAIGAVMKWALPEYLGDLRLDTWRFFWLYLPSIVLDAGYFVPEKELFSNFSAIMMFAVVGTIMNTAVTSLILYYTQVQFHFFGMELGFWDLLIFSTIISAVDPVAVLSVFEEIHINRLLYILVFGESLFNDAVTIVMYDSVQNMAKSSLSLYLCLSYAALFVFMFLAGAAIGATFGVLTGLIAKFTKHVKIHQPLACLIIPYIGYVAAESVRASGIVALTFCGVFMKRYLAANLDESTLIAYNHTLKTMSSMSESIIFAMLGVSIVTHSHVINCKFILVALFCCVVVRALVIFILSRCINCWLRMSISLTEQFVMTYGGLRGAVCYGLVTLLDPTIVKDRDMFTSTVMLIIVFTSIFQGCTIKPIVRFTKVKLAKPDDDERVIQMHVSKAIKFAIAGINEIAGYSSTSWYHTHFVNIRRIVDRLVMVEGAADDTGSQQIVELSKKLMIKDVVQQIKTYGSYRALPTLAYEPSLPTSMSVPNNMGEQKTPPMETRFVVEKVPKEVITITPEMGPRKESLRNILWKAMNHPPEQEPYSRHFMQNIHEIPTFRRASLNVSGLQDLSDDEDYSAVNALTAPTGANAIKQLCRLRPRSLSNASSSGRPTILPGKNNRPHFKVGSGSPNEAGSPLFEHERPSTSHVHFRAPNGVEILPNRHRLGTNNKHVVFSVIDEANESDS